MAYIGKTPASEAVLFGTGSVQSAEIEDGTILDKDLNASANVSASKILFTSGSLGGDSMDTIRISGSIHASSSNFKVTASEGLHITGSTTVSGGNLTLVGSTFSASQARHPDSATGSVEYVKYVHTGSFASGSDIQIIKAESASYVVSTNTGSFASGSDIQIITA